MLTSSLRARRQTWHAHILDTAAYRADCDAIFGQYLDHLSYFGIRGDQDPWDLEDAYADTRLAGSGNEACATCHGVLCLI